MSKARHARTRRGSRRVARTLTIAGLGAGVTVVGAGAAFAQDYVVKPGDTLSQIAQANGTDWHQLATINHLQDPNLILIGQTLTLDGANKASADRDAAPRTFSEKAQPQVRNTQREVRTSRSADRPTSSAKANLSGAWAKVANCESSGNPRAVNGAGYYGLFQFDMQTWRSVGGSGSPASASAAEQLSRAKALYAQRGASPWPVCGKYLR